MSLRSSHAWTGGDAQRGEGVDGGTPRGAAEQAVMQARLAVVTALNSESKEASLTPAAQYYIKVCPKANPS